VKCNLLLSLLCLPCLLQAQTTVKGFVTEQNSGNKPISGVQIKALGTEPELSDNAGQFQLNFTNKKAGDRIIVSEITKKGYEIVNKDIVNNWVITNYADKKTKIIMCPEGLIAKNTLKYYEISLAGLTRGYHDRNKRLQEKLSKTEIDALTYSKLADSLARQFDNQQKQLEKLADKFARENFDDCSAIHQQAFQSFKMGNIEEAIRILETVDSETEIAKAKQQQNKAEKIINEGIDMLSQSKNIIQQNISKLMFQKDLYITSFRFQEAEQCFIAALNADTTNFETIFAFAKYFYNNVELEKSITWQTKALELASNDIDKSEVLNYLGIIMRNTDQIDSAEANFKEAIRIRRKLAESDPKVFNLFLANSLSNIANVQMIKSKYKESEINDTEALNLLKESDMNNPDVKNEIASVLSSLIDIMSLSNQIDKAKKYLTESEKLYNELISINYKEKFNHFAWTPYYRLANIQLKQGKTIEAEANLDTSLNLFRKLANQNPSLYNYKIAIILNDLAVNELNMKQFDKAELNALESVKIHKEIIKLQPWDDLNFASSLQTLYQIQIYKKQFDKSEENFKQVINIYKEHKKINPQLSEDIIANIYENYSVLNFENYQYEIGDRYSKEALKIYTNLVKSKSEYKSSLAYCYSVYAAYQLKNKNFELAESLARKSLETDSSFIYVNTNLALALLFQGKYEEAKKIYIEMNDKLINGEKSKKYKEAFLEDFDWLEKDGVTHPDIEKIREILNQK